MTVSIIVVLKDNNPRLEECISSCLKLEYSDFEILVLPDKRITLDFPKTTVVPTGDLTPPEKRDIAMDKAQGDILAFIDDDAYPDKNWLKNALSHFENPDIAAVGGPAVTPESDSIFQKASGLVYSSLLVGGPYVYRYIPKKTRFVDDYPSCNFIIRKSTMREVSGFNTKFWPGEDTFLCLKIVHGLNKRIVYDPKVLVYHHRRSLFKGHLKQVANYAMHRGYFVKKFPQNSLKIAYFLPSLFIFSLTLGWVSFFINPPLANLYTFCIVLYLLTVFISSISILLALAKSKPLIVPAEIQFRRLCNGFRLTFLVFWGIILTHIYYGLYFMKGLLSQRLKEE